jgi:spermidine/putrescine-binding protein
MWMDSLAITSDAPNPETAKEYVQWMLTPQAQALLASKKAYNSAVPNAQAYPLMAEPVKRGVKVHNGAEATALALKLSVRSLPVQQSEREWQSAWEAFKAGSR